MVKLSINLVEDTPIIQLFKDKDTEILVLNKRLILPEAANVQIPKVVVLEEENHKLQSEMKDCKLSMESWRHKVVELEVHLTTL